MWIRVTEQRKLQSFNLILGLWVYANLTWSECYCFQMINMLVWHLNEYNNE